MCTANFNFNINSPNTGQVNSLCYGITQGSSYDPANMVAGYTALSFSNSTLNSQMWSPSGTITSNHFSCSGTCIASAAYPVISFGLKATTTTASSINLYQSGTTLMLVRIA